MPFYGEKPSRTTRSFLGQNPRSAMDGPLVGVVGPCGAGKSTLVAGLREQGIHAREIAQEHSYVPAMWQRFTGPDLLIYLEVSREGAQTRMGQEWSAKWWEAINNRLAHARTHADLRVETDALGAEAVLECVLQFLTEAGVR